MCIPVVIVLQVLHVTGDFQLYPGDQSWWRSTLCIACLLTANVSNLVTCWVFKLIFITVWYSDNGYCYWGGRSYCSRSSNKAVVCDSMTGDTGHFSLSLACVSSSCVRSITDCTVTMCQCNWSLYSEESKSSLAKLQFHSGSETHTVGKQYNSTYCALRAWRCISRTFDYTVRLGNNWYCGMY